MSQRTDPGPLEDLAATGESPGEPEEIDALPVLSEQAKVLQPQPGALMSDWRSTVRMPAVQAAAVAAGGFVAGAAVVGLVHRRHRHSNALAKGRRGADLGRARRGRATGRAGELIQIVGSRSLLVDVHLLGGSGADG
jgi:hypothetical protein